MVIFCGVVVVGQFGQIGQNVVGGIGSFIVWIVWFQFGSDFVVVIEIVIKFVQICQKIVFVIYQCVMWFIGFVEVEDIVIYVSGLYVDQFVWCISYCINVDQCVMIMDEVGKFGDWMYFVKNV